MNKKVGERIFNNNICYNANILGWLCFNQSNIYLDNK